ncbi:MAG: hypothetical protein ACYS0G_11845 [Planctomycetota bacterium]
MSRIGDDLGSDGTVLVDGADSTWTVDSELFVGNFASGSVTVTNGGAVNTTRVKLGDEPGASGSATVDGPASTWTDTVEIFVGNFGSGSLAVTNGATVSGVRGTIGDDPGSTGTVTVEGIGSTWTSTEQLTVGDLGQGTLTVGNGGTASAPVVSVNAQSVVDGDGTLAGATTSSGTIRPGLSVGELTVEGTYVQTGQGRLEIELACSGGDTLTVDGSAQLAGTLDLSVIGGSEPVAGQQFSVLTAAGVNGTFDQVNAPPGVDVAFEAGAVIVTVVDGPTVIGDLNQDGTVGISDLLILLASWGPCPPKGDCPADLNDDGIVGISDLLTLLANWGSGCG